MPSGLKQNLRILCVVPAWNEEKRVGAVVRSIPKQSVDRIVVVDDGSSDKTVQAAKRAGASVLHHDRNQGVGAAIRSGIEYARRGKFDVVVVVSGSGKTPCEQIPKILEPIVQDEADVVQGSRYILGGQFVHAPINRRIGTSVYTKIFSLFVQRRVSDAHGYTKMRKVVDWWRIFRPVLFLAMGLKK